VVSSIFQIRSDKEMVDITYKLAEPVVRGGYELKKNDADEKTHKDGDTYTATTAQGDASLAGFTYEIYNISASYVWVDKNGNGEYDDSEFFDSLKTTINDIFKANGSSLTVDSITYDTTGTNKNEATATLPISWNDVKNLTSCYELVTDDTGYAATGTLTLPYGTYEIKEIYPPTGYLMYSAINPDLSVFFEIRGYCFNENYIR
jgi:hypothetical protein